MLGWEQLQILGSCSYPGKLTERGMVMIHEEKWYTCDRCGERIENLVEDVLNCLPEEVSVNIPRDDYLKIMSGESDISIVNAEFDGEDTEAVTIRKRFLTKEDTIHLCGKCKREFERFMKNE